TPEYHVREVKRGDADWRHPIALAEQRELVELARWVAEPDDGVERAGSRLDDGFDDGRVYALHLRDDPEHLRVVEALEPRRQFFCRADAGTERGGSPDFLLALVGQHPELAGQQCRGREHRLEARPDLADLVPEI